jgi:hypothetical protein
MVDTFDDIAEAVANTETPFDDAGDALYTEYTVTDNDGQERTRRHYAAVDAVNYWLEHTNSTFTYKTGQIKCTLGANGVELPFNRIHRLMILHADKSRVPFSQTKSELALQEWLDIKRDSVLAEYKRKLFAEPSKEIAYALATKLVKAWTGSARDLDVYAVLHFIWQVKRKLAGMKVEDHLMPVLVGKQGGGKSQAVHKFLAPVYDLYSDLNDLRALADERQLGLLSSNFVLFADEMGKGEKVPVDLLKNAISGVLVKQRMMRTTEHTTLTHRSTFIGAANEQLNDIIHDATGMRRYWQITCSDRLDWDVINSFDVTLLWQSVGIEWSSIYSEHRATFYAAQDVELRSKTSIEQFFDDCEDYSIPKTPEEGEWIKASTIYEDYSAYCMRSKTTAFGRTKFIPRVKALGVESKKGNSGLLFRVAKIKSGPIAA